MSCPVREKLNGVGPYRVLFPFDIENDVRDRCEPFPKSILTTLAERKWSWLLSGSAATLTPKLATPAPPTSFMDGATYLRLGKPYPH